MADWNTPGLTTAYATFLTNMKDRDLDALKMQAPSANIPTGAMRFNRAGNVGKFEEYSGAAWVAQLVQVAGGGTGAGDAASARTNLGLGTIATQNANGVAITGGSIADCSTTFTADDQKVIGSNANRLSKLYLRSGLVIPVGTDKYLTS